MHEPRTYLVNVHNNDRSAFLVCIVYFLDADQRHRGFEFYQHISSFPTRGLPHDRQATFTEELKATDFAALANSNPERRDEDIIQTQLGFTFGPGTVIDLKKVLPTNTN